MQIHGVTLTNFRGIDHKELTFQSQGITVISGPNQSGKSSVIEAIGLVLGEKATSKKEQLRNVLKHDAGQPAVVEIDVTIGDERLELCKTFGAGRFDSNTQLVFPGGKKEPLYGSPAHKYVQELLDKHEDTALFEALRFLQGEDSSSFRLTQQQSALQTALDAAADIQHSGDHEGLLTAVDAEFAKYFTPTGKENKDFKTARKELVELENSVAETQAQIDQVHESSEELATLESDTEKLRTELAEQQATLTKLTDKLTRSEEQAKEIDQLTKHNALLDKQLEDARKLLNAQQKNREQLQTFTERRESFRKQLAELTAKNDADLSEQQQEVVEKDEEFRLASQAATVVRLVQKETQLAGESKDLHRLLGEAEALDKTLEENPHQESIFSEAKKHHDRISQIVEASRVAATMATIRPHSHEVIVAGEQISSDTTLQISENTTIDVPGVVSIELAPGKEAVDLQAEQTQHTELLGQLLAELQVDTWEDAEEQRSDWESVQQKLDQVKTEIKTLTAHESLSEIDERLAETRILVEEQPIELVERARTGEITPITDDELAHREQELVQLREALQTAETELAMNRQTGELVTARLQEIDKDIAALDSDDEDLEVKQAECDELQDKCRTAAEELAHLQEEFVAPAELQERIDSLAAQLQQSAAELKQRDQEVVHAKAALEVRLSEGYQGKLQEVEAECDTARAALADMVKKANAVKRLRQTLDEARKESAQRYQEPYVEVLHKLGRKVWGEGFHVIVGDDLEISSAATKSDGHPTRFAELSAGTREQLAVLSRLACFELVDRGAVPVVLDDVFGYSDPERLHDMLDVLRAVVEVKDDGVAEQPLGQLNAGGQIFVFTCARERFEGIPALYQSM